MTSTERNKNLNKTKTKNKVCSKHGNTHWINNNNNSSISNNVTKVSKHNHRNLQITRCNRHHSRSNRPIVYPHSVGANNNSNNNHKTESVLSSDSDIRFTHRKLGDSQKCGFIVIASFLVSLLLAGLFIYIGYIFLRPEPLPERIFRGKFTVIDGDKFSQELLDQKSFRFQHKARDYRERLNLVVKRSDLRKSYEGSEILALDGTDDVPQLIVHFNLIFDPYQGLVSAADLIAIFTGEINSPSRQYLKNLTIDSTSLEIKDLTGINLEEPITTSSAKIEGSEEIPLEPVKPKILRRCEPIRLNYCKAVGYNITTYPNLLGHTSLKEVEKDLIAFRELVDAECFTEAYDFICRLLQPPCQWNKIHEPVPELVCREYCQIFQKKCGSRIPARLKTFFDCELFPEITSMQSCRHRAECSKRLGSNAQSPRLCDGIPDCPDLSDEQSCTFCPKNFLYCGRGRACVAKNARCDGKLDCPDGADEKDCLSIAPFTTDLTYPTPLVPFLPKFYSEGFAIFSEKGSIGKLCAEGLENAENSDLRQTVAESLCKSLTYESVDLIEIRNDTENVYDYVRVLDPNATEISFVRTTCLNKRVLYVGCNELQCGIQSVLPTGKKIALPKMAAPGDWPWFVSLFREDTHVCDGTLISAYWVLTTESCFQGQPRATWLAIFGSVRLNSIAPWTQRRRIIGMVKSPVEGSTAALIRLETPVSYSDMIRPVCLPDELKAKLNKKIFLYNQNVNNPKAEQLKSSSKINNIDMNKTSIKNATKQITDYFYTPLNKEVIEDIEFNNDDHEASKIEAIPKPEALANELEGYPLPEKTPQMQYYAQQPNSTPKILALQYSTTQKSIESTWTNCNTLGWSRQRDHLQRVQLKIGTMDHCENISIATVNSMCTEATYHKNDCTEEEFAGAPVQCLIPETNQWALIGISSWRIGCGPTGIERPRMYDKISSNTQWIRSTVNSR